MPFQTARCRITGSQRRGHQLLHDAIRSVARGCPEPRTAIVALWPCAASKGARLRPPWPGQRAHGMGAASWAQRIELMRPASAIVSAWMSVPPRSQDRPNQRGGHRHPRCAAAGWVLAAVGGRARRSSYQVQWPRARQMHDGHRLEEAWPVPVCAAPVHASTAHGLRGGAAGQRQGSTRGLCARPTQQHQQAQAVDVRELLLLLDQPLGTFRLNESNSLLSLDPTMPVFGPPRCHRPLLSRPPQHLHHRSHRRPFFIVLCLFHCARHAHGPACPVLHLDASTIRPGNDVASPSTAHIFAAPVNNRRLSLLARLHREPHRHAMQ
jgi:hypothetical protein